MKKRVLYLGMVAAAAIIAVMVVVGAPGLLGLREKPDWLVPGARLEYKCEVRYNVPLVGSAGLPAHLTIRVDEVLERGARASNVHL